MPYFSVLIHEMQCSLICSSFRKRRPPNRDCLLGYVGPQNTTALQIYLNFWRCFNTSIYNRKHVSPRELAIDHSFMIKRVDQLLIFVFYLLNVSYVNGCTQQIEEFLPCKLDHLDFVNIEDWNLPLRFCFCFLCFYFAIFIFYYYYYYYYYYSFLFIGNRFLDL